MPDYFNLLRQQQQERDNALRQEQAGVDVQQPIGPEVQQQEPPQQQPEPTREELAMELFRQEQQPLYAEQVDREPLEDNPYTWSPEYTQRGFLEEVGNSLARGFGKHVIGGTGDIIQLVNGIIPGWEIREGNMLSRSLQEWGKEFEDEYKVFLPDELKEPEFTIGTFFNPDFWSKQAAEYIPQLAEMILISRGAGSFAKGAARRGIAGLTEGMSKEALEAYGKKAVVNTSERVLKGAGKKATELAGQGPKGIKDWRQLFMTTTGEATEGFALSSELVGGGLSMNFLAGLQNAGHLMNEMKTIKDPETGEYLYNEKELGEMAAYTMVENAKYLPIDMLSYGMVYAKNTGKFNKLLNPFNKKQAKPFFSAPEQLVASSKSLTQEVRPIMSFLDKMGNKLGRYVDRGRRVASGASKPIFEGFEETFQESWEDWATKKARARVTGEAVTIDGRETDSADKYVGDFWSFYMSKENEATKTIAFALGLLGGGASNIVEAVNSKAEKALKNYSKTELFKNAATNKEAYERQTAFIEEQLVDNALDGNVNSKDWIDALIESEVISEDSRAEWHGLADMLDESAKKAKSMGRLNVAGQLAFLENKLRMQVAQNGYNSQLKAKNEKLATIKEEFVNDPARMQKEINEVERAWVIAEKGFQKQIATAERGALNILSGEVADITNIKHVKDSQGNTVAVALPEDLYNSYYNRTDQEVYEDAKVHAIDPRPLTKMVGNKLKEFYKSAAEKLGKAKDNAVEKSKEYLAENKAEREAKKAMESKKVQELKPEDVPNLKRDIILGKDDNGEDNVIDVESLKKVNKEKLPEMLKIVNDQIKKYNKSLEEEYNQSRKDDKSKGRSFDEENKEKAPEEKTKRQPTEYDEVIKESFENDEPGNLEKADQEILDQVKNIDFTKEKEATAEVLRLIKQNVGRIGEIAFTNKIKDGELVQYVFDLVNNQSNKADEKTETKSGTTETSNRGNAGNVNKNDEAKKTETKKPQVNKNEAIKMAERQAAKDLNQVNTARAQMFDNPNFKKGYQKAIKKDPNNKKLLQESYDAFLDSVTAKAELGPRIIIQQIALNQHLRRLFPNTKIEAFAMNNLAEATGRPGLGFAIGTALMIDEKVWHQDDIFMHEFLHVHYELTKNEPATIAILKEAARDKALVEKMYRLYDEQTVYVYKQKGWKPGMKKAKAIKGRMTDTQKKHLSEQLGQKHGNGKKVAYTLPIEQQPILLDELFAHYMQGPMSDQFGKYFIPRTDFARQIKVKGWWKWLKSKAVENEEKTIDVLKALNEGKEVPIENLKSFIINGFVNTVRGKDVTLKGRLSLSEDQMRVIDDKHKDIVQRLNNERAGKIEEMIQDVVAKSNPEKIGTVNEEDDFWNEPEEVMPSDFFTEEMSMKSEANDSGEMDLATYWDKGFELTNLKNNKMLNYYVVAYNKAANQRKDQKIKKFKELIKNQNLSSEEKNQLSKDFFQNEDGVLVDATYYEGINLSKFNEELMDLAKTYDTPMEFIRVLEDSKEDVHREFIKHMKKEYKDPLQRLVRMHLLYTNSEVLPAIISYIDKNGFFETKVPDAPNDATVFSRTKDRVVNADTETLNKVNEAFAILEAQERPDKYDEAIEQIVLFYTPDLSIAKKILQNNRMILNKRNVTLYEGITTLMQSEKIDGQEDYFLNLYGLEESEQIAADEIKRRTINYNPEIFIQSLQHTGRLYSAKSGVYGPNKNMDTTRMFGNHSIKLFNKMTVALKNSENTAEAKSEFITKFSNSNDPITKNFNPVLDAFWENYHNTGELPLMILDLGSENEMYNKAKKYKNASAQQHLLGEVLQFMEGLYNEGNLYMSNEEDPNYYASMDILGDSSRRTLLSVPRIDDILTQQGTIREAHLAKMYKIYTELSFDNKKKLLGKDQVPPKDFGVFKQAMQEASNDWIKYFEDNLESLTKFKQFESLYEKNSKGKYHQLSNKGKELLTRFTYNRIANTFYMHEILSPGLFLNSITKVHKGQIAPVIALDPNLKVEMIPMADEFKQAKPVLGEYNPNEKPSEHAQRVKDWEAYRIITNDGMQYILQEHADAIKNLNTEFNDGYKLYSYSIEKENPYFMNQTSQMKGYTTVLTEEAVTTGNQQHLYPIWKVLNDRNQKFKEWYKAQYGEDYNPEFRTQAEYNEQRPKYMPIIVPVSADKTSIFSINELNGFLNKYTLEELKNPQILKEYNQLLDKIYYSNEGQFQGLDGSNFGPQQIMDKPYTRANLSIQAITSIPHGQTKQDLTDALKIQDLISQQKWYNIKRNILDKINPEDDYSYSQLILDTANRLDSDPYTIRALLSGELPYSPHVADFALNQIRALIIREGNNLSVPGTYGQTISDLGYKFVSDENTDAYISKPNRERVYPYVKEEYINGTNKLNFYGIERIDKVINGKNVKSRTIPIETILPKNQAKDVIPRQSFYSKEDGGFQAAYDYLTRTKKVAGLKNQYINLTTLKRLGLVDSNDQLIEGAVSEMLNNPRYHIYSSIEATPENRIGVYIPGETVMMTRVPNNSQAFVAVAEVVGFHDTNASNIVVPAEFSKIIGSDHDGDALFVYKKSKLPDGSIDTRTEEGEIAKYKDKPLMTYWNQAFDMMVDQWLSHNMRSKLMSPLDFEDKINKIIKENDAALNPEKAERIQKIKDDFDKKLITNKEMEERIEKENEDKKFVMPFSPKHYTEQYNNSVIAKQTIGVAFNMHRAINMMSIYKTELANGTTNNQLGNEIVKKAQISINGESRNQFMDFNSSDPEKSRIQLSTILSNIVLDSTKNGHADALNLNLSSIAPAMVLVNLGFDIGTIGKLFNHPIAKEFIEKRNNINNDYIDSGGYSYMIYKYGQQYKTKINDYYGQNVDVNYLMSNGRKNPYYLSDENKVAIIRLMNYINKVSDDINIISSVVNGHKFLENNPFVLEDQIENLENLLNNNKRDTFDRNIKNSTLYFRQQSDRTVEDPHIIHDSPEIKHYIRIAKEYAQLQKKMNIINNLSVKEILDIVKNDITIEKLNPRQLKEYTEKLQPFIYARLLGFNNMPFEEVQSVFQDEESNMLPLSQKLHEHALKLNENVYFVNPDNALDKYTEYTSSRLFMQGIIYNPKEIRINPQLLQQHFGRGTAEEINNEADDAINLIRQEFAELPLKLQKELVLYDLVKYGFRGEKSLYPIFPYEITSYITEKAKEFQNRSSDAKFNENVVKEAFKRLLNLETYNNESNNLPRVFLEESIALQAGLQSDDPAFDELYEKLQRNKKFMKKVLGTKPFRMTVVHPGPEGKNISDVIEITPVGNILSNEEKQLVGDSNADNKRQAKAKETGKWDRIAAGIITDKRIKGHQFFKKAKTDLLPLEGETEIINVNMMLIEDRSTIPTEPNRPLILKKQLVEQEWAEYEAELLKKKDDVAIGRSFDDDYHMYTGEKLLPEQFFAAYQNKQRLTDGQKGELYNTYSADKKATDNAKEKWVDNQGRLLKINPETGNPFTSEELIKGYEEWGKRDAYASAAITVPIMLELIQRESNKQTKEFTHVEEGTEDIPLMKAWLQTNNIDSTHPATQAIQREIETEFKYFLNERKRIYEKIDKVTEDLYKEKLGYNPRGATLFKKIQLALKLLFKNRDQIYRHLYGNIIKESPETRRYNGQNQKRYGLLSEGELITKLNKGEISQAEYNFAYIFREITKELDPAINQDNKIGGGIPWVGPGRLEAFGRKGLLGVLTTTRPLDKAIYDVQLNFEGENISFKEIEDIFRQEYANNWKNNIQYIKLRNKAYKLYKKGINEDGSTYKHSDVWNHTLLGDGMINNFANGGWVDENQFLSLDLNRALTDYAHTQLFISGNSNFQGFKSLQAKVDGLLLHNRMKGFTNQNKFVQGVYKEYFLKGKKLNPRTSGDVLMDALIKGNLLYIMGWKLLAVGKGMYAIGNIVVGKYNNIKNQGGQAWVRGEKRFWGIDQNGSKNKKALGVLKTLNFSNDSFYDDVSIQRSSGLDNIITDIAMLPMVKSEQWIQGVHFLGMLTEEQWNRFDDEGNYKPGATMLLPEETIAMENTVKSSHGKGYTPTDQRLIQRYSWGRAIMQFSRFIPTMFYDRFAKEDINIYGQRHIGSLRAVWEPVAKFVGGEISVDELRAYRQKLKDTDPEKLARFDSGLKGMAMVSIAMIAGKALNLGVANELVGDANYLVNHEKLEYKMFPSSFRTVKDLLSPLVPN